MTPVAALALGKALESEIGDAACDEAAVHRLAGFLHHHVSCGSPATRSAHRRLAVAHLAERQRQEQMISAIEALGERLGEQVGWALTKGLSVATRWYPEPTARHATDIDVWIDPRAPDGMALAMRALGAEDRCDAVALMSSTGRVFSEVVRVRGVPIDVHRDAMSLLLPARHAGRLWTQHVAPTRIAGRDVMAPSLELSIVIAAVNAARDGFPTWRNVADLRLMMDAQPDWYVVNTIVDDEGWTPIVGSALQVVCDLAGRENPIPPGRAQRAAIRLLWPRTMLQGSASKSQMRRRQSAVSMIVDRRRTEVATTTLRRLGPERQVIDHRTKGRYREHPYPVALARWRLDQRRRT